MFGLYCFVFGGEEMGGNLFFGLGFTEEMIFFFRVWGRKGSLKFVFSGGVA